MKHLSKDIFIPSTADQASLNVVPGSAVSNPESGDIWNESGALKFRTLTDIKTLATTDQLISSASAIAYTPTAPITSTTVQGALDQVANAAQAATASCDGYATAIQIAKLDGIAAGAEVNVNADWNAESGSAQILNKPLTYAPSAHTIASHSDWPAAVSMTEVGYLDGVTSSIQTQVDGKMPLAGTTGAVAFGTVTTTGNVGIGTASPAYLLTQKSTSALESASLGAELAVNNWTTTGWTGNFASGFTHTTGNTTALTNTLAATVNNLYQISYTVTNRTTGSFVISFGGVTAPSAYATGAWGPKATSTGTLSITPTSDFNGTIVISVKQITGIYSPTYVISDSTGNNTLEIHSSLGFLNNTFIGKNAGRYNTTGNNNSAHGVSTLQSNTTGYSNTAQGVSTLQSNTTGYNNSAHGVSALQNNTTGYGNSAHGVYALQNNTTGYNNSAHGVSALQSNTTGNSNAAHGVSALQSNNVGYSNAAQGYAALYNNTSGYCNAAHGAYALFSNTTGYNNLAQGVYAGRYISGGSTANQTSNNSIYIGYNSMALANGDTNEIVIGASATGNGSNSVTLGNNSITKTVLTGNVLLGTTTDDGSGAKLQVNGGIRSTGQLTHVAPTSLTLSAIRECGLCYVDDTHIKIYMKGADGTVRSSTLTLA
jgi:hypothetical protein